MQSTVEDFATLLEEDFTLADTAFQQMKYDHDIDPRLLDQVTTLYKEHVGAHTEQCREDMITRNLMHA